MAIWYVRGDGNNNNAGTGYLTSQAFATITKAVSVMSEGDEVRIAPGTYTEEIIPVFTDVDPWKMSVIAGDPMCVYFIDKSPGVIRLATAGVTYITFETHGFSWDVRDVEFVGSTNSGANNILFPASPRLQFTRCYFNGIKGATGSGTWKLTGSNTQVRVTRFIDCDFNGNARTDLAWQGGTLGAFIILEGCVIKNWPITHDPHYAKDSIFIVATAGHATNSNWEKHFEKCSIRQDNGGNYAATSGAYHDNCILSAAAYRPCESGSTRLMRCYIPPSSTSHTTYDRGVQFNRISPPDFSDIGASVIRRETAAPISGTSSLKIIVHYIGRAILARFPCEKGKSVDVSLKLKKSFIGGVTKIRVGGPGGAVGIAVPSSTGVQTITIPFIADVTGVFAVEFWCNVNNPADQTVLIDDLVIMGAS